MSDLKTVQVGTSRQDPNAQTIAQWVTVFNQNMQKVLSQSDNLAGVSEETGLSWDQSGRTLSVSIPPSKLLSGTDNGVEAISQSAIVSTGLAELGADPNAVSRLTNDIGALMTYRENLLSLKVSDDYLFYRLVFIQEQIFSLPQRIAPIYYWDDDATDTPDDVNIIKPDGIATTAKGRWVLSQYEPMKASGAGNSIRVSPDTAPGSSSLRNALEGAIEGATVILSPGVYDLDGPIDVANNVSIIADAGTHLDPTRQSANQVILRAINENQTALRLTEGCFLQGLTVESNGADTPLIEISVPGVDESDGSFAYTVNKPIPNVFRRCLFRPKQDNQSVGGIALKTDTADKRVGPLDQLVKTCDVEDCYFFTYGGVAVKVQDYHLVNIVDTRFEYTCKAVAAPRQGIAFLDRCSLTAGSEGLNASGNDKFRHVAYLKASATSGDTKLTLKFAQSNNVVLDHQFYPRPPTYITLTTDTGTSFSSRVIEITDRIYGGDTAQYEVKLADSLNQDLAVDVAFDISQASYIEAINCSNRDVGAGDSPLDRGVIPKPHKLTVTADKGLIEWI